MNYYYPELRDALAEENEDILFLGNGPDGEENHDNAIIGTTLNEFENTVAVYDRSKVIENFTEYMSWEEAEEHFGFNIERSLPYYKENAPIFIEGLGGLEDLKKNRG